MIAEMMNYRIGDAIVYMSINLMHIVTSIYDGGCGEITLMGDTYFVDSIDDIKRIVEENSVKRVFRI